MQKRDSLSWRADGLTALDQGSVHAKPKKEKEVDYTPPTSQKYSKEINIDPKGRVKKS